MEYYKSKAYGKWCEKAYGSDYKQRGMVTDDELNIFYREILLPQGSDILDVGCGSGHLADAISKHYNSKVVGIDIDKNSINYAKSIFFDNENVDFKVLDYNDMVFENESFDLICFFDTLYFNASGDSLNSLLSRCIKMLKSGGKIAIFWTRFGEEGTFQQSEETPIGNWGIANKIDFIAIDLTKKHRQFWQNALSRMEELQEALVTEVDEYDKMYNEFKFFAEACKKGDDSGMFRWMYIFGK